MIHRSRCHRAFSAVPLLVAVVVACAAVLALRSNPTWNGVALSACESQVVAQLGKPVSTFSAGTVTNLKYPGMEVWLRSGRVYCITMQGDHRALYLESCMRFGLPVGTWEDCCDWHYDDIVARLCHDKLAIFSLAD